MENFSKGSSSSVLTLVLTGAQVGELIGVSSRRVRELRDDGAIPDNGAGQYVLGEAVKAYCAHIRPASGKDASGGSEAGVALDAVRMRLITAQAEAREMLNAQMSGEAVLSEDLDAVAGAICDAVRQKMLALPSIAAVRVAGLTDTVTIQELIAALVHDALSELAGTEISGAVKDRAKRRAGRSTDEADDRANDP